MQEDVLSLFSFKIFKYSSTDQTDGRLHSVVVLQKHLVWPWGLPRVKLTLLAGLSLNILFCLYHEGGQRDENHKVRNAT